MSSTLFPINSSIMITSAHTTTTTTISTNHDTTNISDHGILNCILGKLSQYCDDDYLSQLFSMNVSHFENSFSNFNECINTDKFKSSLKQLNYAINELIQSESVYVKNLDEIEMGYLNRLQQKNVVDSTLLNKIFFKISELRNFHKQFYSQIKINSDDTIKLGQIFIENAVKFEEIYGEFCSNYYKAISSLEQAQKSSTLFWIAVVNCQNELGHQLSLSTYLLKPIQRVMKYHLILQECVKHLISMRAVVSELGSVRDSIDPYLNFNDQKMDKLQTYLDESISSLKQATERMISATHYVNERQRFSEFLNRLRSMRSDVDSWGDLVLNDYFRIPGKKDLRLVLLFQHAVIICKHTTANYSNLSSTTITNNNNINHTTNTSTINTTTSNNNNNNNSVIITSTNNNNNINNMITYRTSISNSPSPTMISPTTTTTITSVPATSFASMKTIDLKSIEIREVISCANLMLVEYIPKDLLAFHIVPFDNPKAQLTLRALSEDLKHYWCHEIKRLILENYDAAIPDHVKHIFLNKIDVSKHKQITPNKSSSSLRSADSREKRYHHKSDTVIPDFSLLVNDYHSKRSSSLDKPSNLTCRNWNDSVSTNLLEIKQQRKKLNSLLDETLYEIQNRCKQTTDDDNNNKINANGYNTLSTEYNSITNENENDNKRDNEHVNQMDDRETDFRCIAVEINEERFGLFGENENSKSEDENLKVFSILKHSDSNSTVNQNSHSDSMPTKSHTQLNSMTSIDIPQKNFATDHTLIYIDCPNKSSYDKITFGRTYEQYISKARTAVALSSDDLDEIFSPLRQLAANEVNPTNTNQINTVITSSIIGVQEDNVATSTAIKNLSTNSVEIKSLSRFRLSSQSKLSASELSSTNLPIEETKEHKNQPTILNTINKSNSSSSIVHDLNYESINHGYNSSGASSPRHLVSQIAINPNKNNDPNQLITKTINFVSIDNSTTLSNRSRSSSLARLQKLKDHHFSSHNYSLSHHHHHHNHLHKINNNNNNDSNSNTIELGDGDKSKVNSTDNYVTQHNHIRTYLSNFKNHRLRRYPLKFGDRFKNSNTISSSQSSTWMSDSPNPSHTDDATENNVNINNNNLNGISPKETLVPNHRRRKSRPPPPPPTSSPSTLSLSPLVENEVARVSVIGLNNEFHPNLINDTRLSDRKENSINTYNTTETPSGSSINCNGKFNDQLSSVLPIKPPRKCVSKLSDSTGINHLTSLPNSNSISNSLVEESNQSRTLQKYSSNQIETELDFRLQGCVKNMVMKFQQSS